MGPVLTMFGERPLVNYVEKADGMFAAGLGSWLGCYRELLPNFSRFHTLARHFIVVVRTGPVWGPYLLCLVKPLVDCIFKKADANFAAAMCMTA
jgi:hypothetical protein